MNSISNMSMLSFSKSSSSSMDTAGSRTKKGLLDYQAISRRSVRDNDQEGLNFSNNFTFSVVPSASPAVGSEKSNSLGSKVISG